MKIVFALAGVVIKELYRRKDFYVLFFLTALVTLLMGALNIFDDGRVVRYLKEICLLLIWISALVIALVTTARQIPAERESRTIFPLLAKPVTRGHVVLGKFLGCWLAAGISLVVFYTFFCLVSASREHTVMWTNYFQALWLHWWMLAIVVAMAVCGSVVFAAPSSTVTILFCAIAGILMLGRHLFKVADQMPEPGRALLYAIYYAIPHLEFFDLRDLVIHNVAQVPWWAVAGATAYAMVYSAFFLLGGWLIFRRQTIC